MNKLNLGVHKHKNYGSHKISETILNYQKILQLSTIEIFLRQRYMLHWSDMQ